MPIGYSTANWLHNNFPSSIGLSARQNVSRMNQPSYFDNWFNRKPEQQTQGIGQQLNPGIGQQAFKSYQQPQGVGVTSNYVTDQLQRLQAKPRSPVLQPSARITKPGDKLTDPVNFRAYYEQMNTILGMGNYSERPVGLNTGGGIGSGLFAGAGSAAGGYPGSNKSGHLNLGNVAPHVAHAAQSISGTFGINNIGGWRATGSVPGSDHPHGKAIDVMTYSRNSYDIVNFALRRAGAWKVKYIIYDRWYWVPGRKPTRYTGPHDHRDHVHISFY